MLSSIVFQANNLISNTKFLYSNESNETFLKAMDLEVHRGQTKDTVFEFFHNITNKVSSFAPEYLVDEDSTGQVHGKCRKVYTRLLL